MKVKNKQKVRSIQKISALAVVAFAFVPFAVHAATDTKTTTINALLGSAISINTTGTINLNITPIVGGSQTSGSDTVTVATNNDTGYALTFSDSDTNTSLVKGGDSIAAHTGTLASPTVLAADSWGYRIDGVGGFGAGPTSALSNASSSAQTFAGVPSSAAPATIKTTASTTAGDITTVWFSTKATTAKPNGTYTGVVTYTATTNP